MGSTHLDNLARSARRANAVIMKGNADAIAETAEEGDHEPEVVAAAKTLRTAALEYMEALNRADEARYED